MNPLVILFFALAIVFFAIGAAVSPIVTRVRRLGKTLFICINPRTKAIDVRYAKHKGDVADFTFADDRPKSVALDGPLSYSDGGRRAFLVDTVAGVAFQVTPPPREAPPAGEDGATKTEYMDGAMLNLIRKDTRIQQIAASNSLNLALVLKFLLIGLAIVIVGIIAILALVAQLKGN